MKHSTRLTILAAALHLPIALAQNSRPANAIEERPAAPDVAVEDVVTDNSETADLPRNNNRFNDSIADRISRAEGLSKLNSAIKASSFDDKLSEEGPFTFFAPTNTAFAEFNQEQFENLIRPENRDRLTAILERHLVSGKVTAADMETGTVKTVSGDQILVLVEDESIQVGGATVTMADHLAGNGTFHMIDSFIKVSSTTDSERPSGEPTASTVRIQSGEDGAVVAEVNSAEDRDDETEEADDAREDAAEDREEASDKAEDVREEAEDAAEEIREETKDAAEEMDEAADEVRNR